MARLLPMAVRIDPTGRRMSCGGPCRCYGHRSRPFPSRGRDASGPACYYLDRAELAAGWAATIRAAAEVVFAPVADRLPATVDELLGAGE